MIVISDTTPLISLMKLGKLHLIHELFEEIQIPNAVYQELLANHQFVDEANQIENSNFIKRIFVEDQKSVELLRRATGLDYGESEAIILSDYCKADLLLMDEKKGRQVARQMGLHLMGTIGMLKAAYEEELLSSQEIMECISVLKHNGRYISEKLFQQLLDSIH